MKRWVEDTNIPANFAKVKFMCWNICSHTQELEHNLRWQIFVMSMFLKRVMEHIFSGWLKSKIGLHLSHICYNKLVSCRGALADLKLNRRKGRAKVVQDTPYFDDVYHRIQKKDVMLIWIGIIWIAWNNLIYNLQAKDIQHKQTWQTFSRYLQLWTHKSLWSYAY